LSCGGEGEIVNPEAVAVVAAIRNSAVLELDDLGSDGRGVRERVLVPGESTGNDDGLAGSAKADIDVAAVGVAIDDVGAPVVCRTGGKVGNSLGQRKGGGVKSGTFNVAGVVLARPNTGYTLTEHRCHCLG
jgi:hypothetical protein